ncbi:hypothetical protein OG422_29345 [Streptomyces sp. NBC_01525]|uniref:hypothetical protein n=1 Tax=Streptomyces sp. NBC_01525 TaxID=2903893 RepID=UPI00386D77E6
MTAVTGAAGALAYETCPTYADLVDRVRTGGLGPDLATQRITVAFTTRQAVRHDGRGTGYRNEVLSLRLAEAVVTDALAAAGRCEALLVSGMTLGNGTFEPLRRHAQQHGKQLVMFAQTGSAVLPRFLGHGVSAVCAEPYPFFWLDGGAGVVHRYRGPHGNSCQGGRI